MTSKTKSVLLCVYVLWRAIVRTGTESAAETEGKDAPLRVGFGCVDFPSSSKVVGIRISRGREPSCTLYCCHGTGRVVILVGGLLFLKSL